MDKQHTMAVLQSMSDSGELDAALVARVFENADRLNAIRESAQDHAMREYTAFHSVLESLSAA